MILPGSCTVVVSGGVVTVTVTGGVVSVTGGAASGGAGAGAPPGTVTVTVRGVPGVPVGVVPVVVIVSQPGFVIVHCQLACLLPARAAAANTPAVTAARASAT